MADGITGKVTGTPDMENPTNTTTPYDKPPVKDGAVPSGVVTVSDIQLPGEEGEPSAVITTISEASETITQEEPSQ